MVCYYIVINYTGGVGGESQKMPEKSRLGLSSLRLQAPTGRGSKRAGPSKEGARAPTGFWPLWRVLTRTHFIFKSLKIRTWNCRWSSMNPRPYVWGRIVLIWERARPCALQLDVSTGREAHGAGAPLRGQSVVQCVFTACESIPFRKRKHTHTQNTHRAD